MFTIEPTALVTLPADQFTESPAEEEATLITEGIMLEAGLIKIMPLSADLTHMVSIGNRHIYTLTVRGWTVTQFIAITMAYANQDLEEVTKLVNELRRLPNVRPR